MQWGLCSKDTLSTVQWVHWKHKLDWFTFLLLFLCCEKGGVVGGRGGPGRPGKWVWLGCIMGNSQIIHKNIMLVKNKVYLCRLKWNKMSAHSRNSSTRATQKVVIIKKFLERRHFYTHRWFVTDEGSELSTFPPTGTLCRDHAEEAISDNRSAVGEWTDSLMHLCFPSWAS